MDAKQRSISTWRDSTLNFEPREEKESISNNEIYNEVIYATWKTKKIKEKE